MSLIFIDSSLVDREPPSGIAGKELRSKLIT